MNVIIATKYYLYYNMDIYNIILIKTCSFLDNNVNMLSLITTCSWHNYAHMHRLCTVVSQYFRSILQSRQRFWWSEEKEQVHVFRWVSMLL